MEALCIANTTVEVQPLPAPIPAGLDQQAVQTCLNVLQQIADDPALIDQHDRFKTLIAKIHREGRRGVKQRRRDVRHASDQQLIEQSGIVRQQTRVPGPQRLDSNTEVDSNAETEQSAVIRTVHQPRLCYVCKTNYTELHPFYHLLCPTCGAFNWQKRQQHADLTGRRAVITGGRIKIGYQTSLMLLRDGAHVLITTRFPQDAVIRYSQEPNFEHWKDRLEITGLDLRDLPSVEAFATQLLELDEPLDILIHNAAQTVKRPLAYYRHLLEQQAPATHPALVLLQQPDVQSALLESRPGYRGHLPGPEDLFPLSQFDQDGQQLDLRTTNSWLLTLGEVSTVEMLETWLVSAASPFILTGRLKPLMLKSAFQRRFVINVSAMEGQFNRASKTVYHPHTNMAKAAMNMLTRTSAADLATQGIYMNSVDTGWITDEKPHPAAERVRVEHGFYTPLDIVDGAARIYDPIVTGLCDTSQPVFGQFLKDYRPYPW